jgi:quercetin 2,3-dioxygenase
LVCTELVLAAGSELAIAVDPAFEHGLLVDEGVVLVGGARVAVAELAYLPPGTAEIRVAAPDGPARMMLIGGEPLGEQIVMWWNFIGRDHDEIVAFRSQWQSELWQSELWQSERWQSELGAAAPGGSPRFGVVPGYLGPALPAPVLPGGRLRPRG